MKLKTFEAHDSCGYFKHNNIKNDSVVNVAELGRFVFSLAPPAEQPLSFLLQKFSCSKNFRRPKSISTFLIDKIFIYSRFFPYDLHFRETFRNAARYAVIRRASSCRKKMLCKFLKIPSDILTQPEAGSKITVLRTSIRKTLGSFVRVVVYPLLKLRNSVLDSVTYS